MTYRAKRLFLDSQEVKYYGTFQTEGEAKMRLAQVMEEAFDEQGGIARDCPTGEPAVSLHAPGKVSINGKKP